MGIHKKDKISIINNGIKIIEDYKDNLLNVISKKNVYSTFDKEFIIPKSLENFYPVKEGNKLKLSYDKTITNIKEIIDLLNKEKLDFIEINTYESDLEDVFLKLIKEN